MPEQLAVLADRGDVVTRRRRREARERRRVDDEHPPALPLRRGNHFVLPDDETAAVRSAAISIFSPGA